jgi:hypothetical protein
MYTDSVEFNEAFDRALGHGPEGPTYVAPRARRASRSERVRAWTWYRWGWGSRPGPRHVVEEPGPVDDVARTRLGRHSAEADDTAHSAGLDLLGEDDVA